MNTEVTVKHDKGDSQIFVVLDDITFSAGNLFGIPSVSFFLTPVIAEKLQKFLSATLEDIERQKEEIVDTLELQKGKYGEELREMAHLEINDNNEVTGIG